MDFFTNLIRQPPVTDKHKRHDFSQYSDEFTITRQKGLRGFNDEVSEIEIGSEQINQDSINEIKNQQKLLLGENESNRKMKMQYWESKDSSFDGKQNGLVLTEKINKDSNNLRVSLESKLMTIQFPAPQPQKNQQKKLTKQKNNQPMKSNLSNIRTKKVHSDIVINLAELKKIKSQIKEYFIQQQGNFKKLVDTVRYNLQNEIKKQFLAYASQKQSLISNDLKKIQKGEQIVLKVKLKQSQNLIKEMQKQLQQLFEQNETLQQKLFDMQQKMVGIDLQVQERFQKKKKQLESKILQDVMAKYNKFHSNPNRDFITEQQHQYYSEDIRNLINQNQYLEQKLKSYQTLLLQTDHIRKAKQQMQQLQFTLNERQQQIMFKQRQAEKIFIQANKRSIDLQNTEDSLNKKLNELQQKLRVKEQSLQKWQRQLQQRSDKLNQKLNMTPFGQDYDDFISNKNNNQIKLNFKLSNHETQSIKNGSYQDLFRKGIQQKIEKVQSSRHHKTQCSEDRLQSNNRTIYDPKKHSKYEQFDSTQRQKYYTNNGDDPFFKQKNSKTERLISPKKLDLLNISNIIDTNKASPQFGNKTEIYPSGNKNLNVSSHKLDSNRTNYQPIQIKKVNVDFYRPSSSNLYKYGSQYVPKSPLSQLNGSKTVRFDHVRNVSPHQRESSVSSYNKSCSNSNRLNIDYRDRQYQPSHEKSTYLKPSTDNSIMSGQSKSTNRVSYQGYDMKKSKPKYEVTKLNDLGNKIEFLKSQLKSEIDNMF